VRGLTFAHVQSRPLRPDPARAATERTEAGHRRYSEAAVRRLNQVLALRSLGVPLARIAHALEGEGFTLQHAVTAQLETAGTRLLHARRLRRREERSLAVFTSFTHEDQSLRSM
jgi:DNA-binding transcriptional MerR regulator